MKFAKSAGDSSIEKRAPCNRLQEGITGGQELNARISLGSEEFPASPGDLTAAQRMDKKRMDCS